MKKLHSREIKLFSTLLPRLVITPASLPVRFFASKVQAVIFDIYGTLISSAAGDVGTDAGKGSPEAFQAALHDGEWIGGEEDFVVEKDLIHEGILDQRQQMMRTGVAHPEVDIIKVWHEALEKLDLLKKNTRGLRLSIFSYECRTNPVWPMPNMLSTLETIRNAGVQLGILSNAQFYTPLLLEYFFGNTLDAVGFNQELIVWSCEEGIGKPSKEFYDTMQARLVRKNIKPTEVLYIGNDMIKDIEPANSQGWKSVLFAGDTRSLKLHAEHPGVRDVEPDMVITDLGQLLQILA